MELYVFGLLFIVKWMFLFWVWLILVLGGWKLSELWEYWWLFCCFLFFCKICVFVSVLSVFLLSNGFFDLLLLFLMNLFFLRFFCLLSGFWMFSGRWVCMEYGWSFDYNLGMLWIIFFVIYVINCDICLLLCSGRFNVNNLYCYGYWLLVYLFLLRFFDWWIV